MGTAEFAAIFQAGSLLAGCSDLTLALQAPALPTSTRPRFMCICQALMLVNGVDDLRPEIPVGYVALVDTLVQPLNRNVGRSGAVLLDEVTRCSVYGGGHCLSP
jgi:hypothetical protein